MRRPPIVGRREVLSGALAEILGGADEPVTLAGVDLAIPRASRASPQGLAGAEIDGDWQAECQGEHGADRDENDHLPPSSGTIIVESRTVGRKLAGGPRTGTGRRPRATPGGRFWHPGSQLRGTALRQRW
jgi:hypothetical protein